MHIKSRIEKIEERIERKSGKGTELMIIIYDPDLGPPELDDEDYEGVRIYLPDNGRGDRYDR